MLKRSIIGIYILLAMLFIFACATGNYIKSSYRVLSTAETTYDTALSAAGDLYRSGDLSEEKKDEIIKLANKYKAAYALAKNAIIALEANETDENMVTAETAMQVFNEVSDEFMALISEFIVMEE